MNSIASLNLIMKSNAKRLCRKGQGRPSLRCSSNHVQPGEHDPDCVSATVAKGRDLDFTFRNEGLRCIRVHLVEGFEAGRVGEIHASNLCLASLYEPIPVPDRVAIGMAELGIGLFLPPIFALIPTWMLALDLLNI